MEKKSRYVEKKSRYVEKKSRYVEKNILFMWRRLDNKEYIIYYVNMKTKRVEHKAEDLVKQSNAITEAKHDLSAPAIKAFLLAYSKLTAQDKDFAKFTFPLGEVAKLCGDSQGHTSTLFKTLRALQKESIFICGNDGEYISYIPMPTIRISEKNKSVTFTLNPDLQPLYLDLKAQFTMFPVDHAFRLYGRYSIRMYQAILQWQGKERKDGTWDVELEVRAIRERWSISPHEYKLMSDFRKQVIERAVMEINSAQLGVLLTTLPPKKSGKNITHFVVQARRIDPKEPRHVNPKPATKTEEDALKLKEKHPEKWQEFYDFAMKQEALFSIDREAEASAYADSELKKWAGTKTKKATEDKV